VFKKGDVVKKTKTKKGTSGGRRREGLTLGEGL
jgi:hypothetical protein